MPMILLLGSLLALNAVRDDVDPEPPNPDKSPISAKLVAKKTTYKLDLKGGTAAEYKKTVEQGTAPVVPLDLELVITNNTKSDIRVRTKGSTPKMTLTLKGKSVAQGTPPATPKARAPLAYVVLKPGQKLSIPLDRLCDSQGNQMTKIHSWVEPGEYTLTASFYTLVNENWIENAAKGRPLTYKTLTTRPITLKVEK